MAIAASDLCLVLPAITFYVGGLAVMAFDAVGIL